MMFPTWRIALTSLITAILTAALVAVVAFAVNIITI